MATKTPTKPVPTQRVSQDEPTTDTPVAEKVSETPASVNWDDLPVAEVATYVRSTPVKADPEETTPSAIKSRVTAAFEASLKKGESVYFWQECGTAERAAEFLKLARKYAAHKGMTLRTKSAKAETEEATRAVYAVVTKETRTRKPR